jgi:Spy/CpxP family protein refolding chaperone
MTTKLIIACGFLVAFAAGLVSGVRFRPQAVTPENVVTPAIGPGNPGFRGGPNGGGPNGGGPNGGGPNNNGPRGGGPRGGGPRLPPSFVVQQLNLTPDQTLKMNQVWSDVARSGTEMEDRRRQLRRERDEAVDALLQADSKDAYAKIKESYAQSNDAIEAEWKKAYDGAISQTKEFLSAEQQTQYEAILARNRWPGDRGRGGPGGQRGGRGDSGDGPGRRRGGSPDQTLGTPDGPGNRGNNSRPNNDRGGGDGGNGNDQRN